MLTPILLHDPTSEPSRAVHWFALETDIDLNLEFTWLTRGDHRTADFLRVNPAHQVPALKHGDFCLPEASAILLYLAELVACDGHWVGGSVSERAYTNRYLSWHHTNTRKTITLDYALPVLLMPAYKGDSPPDAAVIQGLKDNLQGSLALLEKFLHERGAFLGGVKPSIADLFISVDLFVLDCDPAGDELIKPFPGVQHWLARLRTRDAYKISHAPWNAVAPRVKDLLLKQDRTPRDPAWVAEACLS